jgi:lysyl-tRNA synthetase class 2
LTTQADKRRRAHWLPPVAGWLTALVGLVNVGSALTPELDDRVKLARHLEPGGFVPVAHALALPAGLSLLVMAVYLGRRRRRAQQLAVVTLIAIGALNLLKGLDVEEALFGWGLAALLVWGRGAFYVMQDRPARLAALRFAPLFVAGAIGASFLAVLAGSGSTTPHFNFTRGAHETLWLMLLGSGPLHFSERFEWVPTAVGVISVGALLAVAWLLFRPLAAPLRRDERGRRTALDLVRRHGDDTLSFFKLRGDKHYLFTPDRRAFVGYGVEGGVLIVSGDPVGPADALPALMRQVRAFAEVRGLKLAVLGASERLREIWASTGLRSFYVGDEAVIDTASFSLEGRAIRKVRQSVTRLAKSGYEAGLHRLGDLDEAAIAELEGVSERWRAGAPERGFSMALDSLRGEHLDDTFVLAARDDRGDVRGFLHFVPVYGKPAASLSFMRRDHDTPNGLTEFLVVRGVEQLRDRGVEELSLNFAAFARLMHSPSGRWERFLGRLATVFNPYFQIESLYHFNAKFFPRWEPRYLLYEGRLGFPRAGVAALWAEGQLPKPRMGARAAGSSSSSG